MSYPNYIFSIFSFVGFLLCSIPFPWHLESWNTGTCLYMAWTGLSCLNQFINSVVWNNNINNPAPVWCDISTRFMVAVPVAIPAASLCINRRLYHISSVQSVTITRAEKRRAIIIDLAIGLGLPMIEMVFQYIAQGHRFNIFEDVGCYPYTYDTPVAYALVSLPPVLIGLVSAVYSFLSIKAFNRTRTQFKEFVSNNSNLSSSRYIRLMCLAGVDILGTVPIGIYALVLNASSDNMRPWKGWADTHSGFSRVDFFPSVIWRNIPILQSSVELSRWVTVTCAFVFFAFFGFADEARKHYRLAVQSVAKHVGISTASGSSFGMFSSNGEKSGSFAIGSNGRLQPILPIFTNRHVMRRHDSTDSFTDISASTGDLSSISSEKEKALYENTPFQDVGNTLADHVPATPSPVLSISSFPTPPEPAFIRPGSELDTPPSK